MKTIVVSAVNIRKGGTLTILRSCLSYLSSLPTDEFRVIALVHKKGLANYNNIEYVEIANSIKSWFRRLWCEYVTMNKISKEIGDIDLWLSLHDTTPRVNAKVQTVYCQTSFPFMKWKMSDLKYDYKIVLFSILTKFAYKININRNKYLIVQADWLRKDFSKMFGISESKFIVFPPNKNEDSIENYNKPTSTYQFIFAATPDCHKNFEIICRAVKSIEECDKIKFKVFFTIDGTENKYARDIYKKYHNIDSIEFIGFLKREQLYKLYSQSDCLIFPSRIETWGLPISEFGKYNKPMLLADMPYAHEAASGCRKVSFFDINNHKELASKVKRLIAGDTSFLSPVNEIEINGPKANSWEELLNKLISLE